jgi:CheY-like chemotaxis protein
MPLVLYAEDDAEHRLMMRVILKNTNIKLLEASNGEETLQKIRDRRPDLVLLDLFMPKLDGFGVMDIVKADPELQQTTIVVLSAWPTGDNRERARLAGAVDFIAKPYDPVELVNLLNNYLAAQAPAQAKQIP